MANLSTLLTPAALARLQGAGTDGFFASPAAEMSPSEVNHHLRRFLQDTYRFRFAADVYGFLALLSNATSGNSSWSPEDGQLFLSTIGSDNGLLRIGDILSWREVAVRPTAATHLAAQTLPKKSIDTSPSRSFSRPFTEDEIDAVKDHIRKNCLGAATGLDDVAYEQIIQIPSPQLCSFFQACIDEGNIPQRWVIAIVAAVKKPNKDASSPDSYRTIGLESCLLKTITILIDRRLREWAEQTGRLPDSQSGFRKGHRTINNPFVLRTMIEKAASLGRTLYVVFLDIVNAFPSVNQATLWAKLASWGASGPLIDWLRTLYDRLVYTVRFNGDTTEIFRALAGILIGDPASPILWILLISDLALCPHPDDVRLAGHLVNHLELADDATMATMSPPSAQGKLGEILSYFDWNFLLIGPSKTKGMAFGALPDTLPMLTVGSDVVSFVEEAKYTGTTFTSTAKDIFSRHYVIKAKSARNIANASLSLESYIGPLPPSIATLLYNARVDPHLTMGCEVALDVNPASIDHLERVQVAYLRRILGLGSRSQLVPLYTETGVWPLRYRRAALSLRYLAYVLRSQPPLPAAALQEAWEITQDGHTSWWSDLCFVLENLPEPVPWNRRTFPTTHLILDTLRALEASLARYLHAEVLKSKRLPLLAHRFRRTPSPPLLSKMCRPRSYLKIACTPHREALTRLLTSDHPFAIEALRRVPGHVARELRICRFCRRRWAIEDEYHVLMECAHEAIAGRRTLFYSDVEPLFRGDLYRMVHRLSSAEFIDCILRKDSCLPSFGHYIFDIFQLVLAVPLLLLADEAALLTLAE